MATSAKQGAKNPNLQAVPEPAQAQATQPKPKSKKLLIIVLLLAIILGGAGGAAWYFLGGEAEPLAKGAKPVPKAEPGKPPVFVTLEPFTINLASGSPDHTDQFLQVALTLQVSDRTQEEIVKQYMPQVRSRLLLLLSSRKAADISTPEGKNKLSDDIIAQVKQPFAPGMPPQNVTGVFFTSFVIQ